MAKDRLKVLITEEEIDKRLGEMAAEINEAYKDSPGLLVVGLLRGSFVFIADLVRRLDLPLEVDFMVASSYGTGMESSREVRILKDLDDDVEGRDLLLVEDIVDTGHTLDQVIRLLATRKPRSLRLCTLLSKPSRREVGIRLDWCGFEIPDAFVVGYGIDYAQRNRNLPFIAEVLPAKAG
jgi:hypoxanthine phosphoribosyltransferase